MKGIYIGATSGYAGKNMMAMGIGLKFQKDGLKVGYMKPVGAVPYEKDGVLGDEDAHFVQDLLGLDEDLTKVTPVVVDEEFKTTAFAGECDQLIPNIEASYKQLSKDKDVMVVSGSGSMFSGKYCNLDGVTLVKKLGIKAMIIDRYMGELKYDYLAVMQEQLGDHLAGIVLNDIPPDYMEEVEKHLLPFFKRKGIKVLGVFPSDSLMSAIKIGDLASRLGGKVITGLNKSDQVVEDFLIGTMQVENFMTHFKKTRNSAIIVGGDRSDVQLVALEGNTQCLILTGNLYPNDIIMTRAEVLNVPIVLVKDDTFTVAQKMESILSRHKLREMIKIQHGAKLVSSTLDFDYLKSSIGLT